MKRISSTASFRNRSSPGYVADHFRHGTFLKHIPVVVSVGIDEAWRKDFFFTIYDALARVGDQNLPYFQYPVVSGGAVRLFEVEFPVPSARRTVGDPARPW
ncbi:MAG: hypothetical protein IPK21_21795 [Haliscomenobacter sp.]|nr:hypothetical protein [Haliscomenobacter sp.]